MFSSNKTSSLPLFFFFFFCLSLLFFSVVTADQPPPPIASEDKLLGCVDIVTEFDPPNQRVEDCCKMIQDALNACDDGSNLYSYDLCFILGYLCYY